MRLRASISVGIVLLGAVAPLWGFALSPAESPSVSTLRPVAGRDAPSTAGNPSILPSDAPVHPAPSQVRDELPPVYACDAQTAFYLGCAKLEAGNIEAAVADLRVALAKRPDEREYAIRLAEACLRSNRLDEALRLVNVPAAPADAVQVATLRAEIEAKRDNWPAVVAALVPVEAELAPPARLLLAKALRRCSRPAQAGAVLGRAVRAYGNEMSVRAAWIADAVTRGQFATALQRCEEAERIGFPRGAALALRAEALFGSGDVLGRVEMRALADVQIGQLLEDGVVFARGRNAEEVRVATGECALVSARRALDSGVDTPALWLVYARCLLAGRQEHAAWAVVQRRRAALLEESEAPALLEAAEVAVAAGRLADYVAFVEQAAKRDPQRGPDLQFSAYGRLAEEYNLRGEEAESLAFLNRALELRPDDAEMRLRVADALWAAGERVLASDNYRLVLSAAPGHPERRRMLQRLAEFAELDRPAVAGGR